MLSQSLTRSVDRLIAVLALARAGLGLWSSKELDWSADFHLPLFTLLLCFVGCWLHLGQRESDRGRLLALALVVAGSAFASTPLREAGLQPFARLSLDAFFAWYLWRFVELMPKAHDTPTMKTVLRFGQNAALLLASAAVALATVTLVAERSDAEIEGLVRLRSLLDPHGWALASLAAVLVFALRFRRASQLEKRGARIMLVASVALAIAATMIAIPADEGQETTLRNFGLAALSLFVAFMAYSWIVQRSQPFRRRVPRLAAYRSLQVGVWIASLTPLVVIVPAAMTDRGEPRAVESIAVWALIAIAAGALRPLVLSRLRRTFEGVHTDSSFWLPTALADLAAAQDGATLSALVRRIVRQHLRSADAKLWFLPETSIADSESLPAASRLPEIFDLRNATYNREEADPFATEERLRPEDRELLDRLDIALLAPVRSAEGRILATLALSTKATEEAYRSEEVAAVDFLASAIGLQLERLHRAEPSTSIESGDSASVCRRCSRLFGEQIYDCPQCDLPTFSADVPRQLGNRFLLERRLGTGSFGSVYAGRDLDLHRPVAIKSLDPKRSSSESLAREAAAAARLSHPHVAVAYSLERWHGRRLLVTELLEGGTLKDLLDDGPLDQTAAVSITIQVAEALRAAHDSGFTHGDVKPSNIGFTAGGTPKLIDLGLVAVLDESKGSPSSGSSGLETTRALPGGGMGTPLYASPEVFAGNPAGSTDDLWSLNVVLWECLTGSNPFAVGDLESVGRAVIAGCQSDPRSVGAQCSDDVADLLRKGLAAHLGHRHIDADDLLTDLQGAL